jgi:hypothetical protein
MAMLIVAFRNFARALKSYSFQYISLYEISSSFWCEKISLEVCAIILDNILHIIPINRFHQPKDDRGVPLYIHGPFYVYWIVHHLDSWIKIDQLDVTCFIISLFTAQHVSDVSTSIFMSLWLTVDLFHVLFCSGSMCVDVTVWFGWLVWYPYAAWSSASACIRIPHHPSRTTP